LIRFPESQNCELLLTLAKSGEIDVQNYELNNNSSIIRCVLSYKNYLLIVKKGTSDDNEKEKIYLIPNT
jgi:hypothetical protein